MAEDPRDTELLALRRQLDHTREDHRKLVTLLMRGMALLSCLLLLAMFLVPFVFTPDGPFWMVQLPTEVAGMGDGPRKGEAAMAGFLLFAALLVILVACIVESTLARRMRGPWRTPMVTWAPWLLIAGMLPFALLVLVVTASENGDAPTSFPAMVLGIAAIPPAFFAQALAGHLDWVAPPSR